MKHPIPIKNEFIEVWWLNQWIRVRYDGWEPVTEYDFRQPICDGGYRILYHVTPFHTISGKPCSQWRDVHHTRVRPIRKAKTK